jgi:hypothetical protein
MTLLPGASNAKKGEKWMMSGSVLLLTVHSGIEDTDPD